jgi:hypothetical protein
MIAIAVVLLVVTAAAKTPKDGTTPARRRPIRRMADREHSTLRDAHVIAREGEGADIKGFGPIYVENSKFDIGGLKIFVQTGNLSVPVPILYVEAADLRYGPERELQDMRYRSTSNVVVEGGSVIGRSRRPSFLRKDNAATDHAGRILRVFSRKDTLLE